MRQKTCLTGVKAIVLIWLAVAGSGCVPARGYFTDRWRDAKDIFTASVGTGGGVKARVGPLRAGLFSNSDIAGLRAGECFYMPGSFSERTYVSLEDNPHSGDLVLLIYACEAFDPQYATYNRPEHPEWTMRRRKKALQENSFIPYAGILVPLRPQNIQPYYYTQIEVAVGVGGTVRLGFNPGELLDFILGWFNIDIFGDDLEARRYREEKKKAKEKPTEETPAPPAAGQPGPSRPPEGVH